MAEVQADLVASRPDAAHRQRLWRDFEDFVTGQKAHGLVPIAYWIDGSFASHKVAPADIDFTSIINGEDSQPVGAYESFLSPGRAWQSTPHPVLGRTIALDAYAIIQVPPGHPDAAGYMVGRRRWFQWWQLQRPTGMLPTKGFLEVLP